MPWVYILRCRDGTLYTGWTVDVARRVAAHNAGRGGRYTRGRRPVELAYTEPLPTKSDALRREAVIKKLTRAEKLALIESGARGIALPFTDGVPSMKTVSAGAGTERRAPIAPDTSQARPLGGRDP